MVMRTTLGLPAALLLINLTVPCGLAERLLGDEQAHEAEFALQQCSAELDECRTFVRASRVDDGEVGSVATDGRASSFGSATDFLALAGISADGASPSFSRVDGVTSFAALNRAATEAANASAVETIRKSAPGVLAAKYEERGQVTLRHVWPRAVALLALQELEEVWQHYRLPATYQGTAFIRAEKDNERIEGAMDFPPFDRLYNIEERSPALRRLITSSGLGEIAATLMGVKSVSLYMSSYFRKAPGDHPSQWHKDADAAPFSTKNFVTMWISLSDLNEDSGGLTYGLGSHKDECTFWECELPCETVDGCYKLYTADDLLAGDASFHAGATFHYSGANTSPHVRPALALAFVETGAQIKSERDLHERMLQNDRQAWERWLDGSKQGRPGSRVDSHFVPVVYMKAPMDTE